MHEETCPTYRPELLKASAPERKTKEIMAPYRAGKYERLEKTGVLLLETTFRLASETWFYRPGAT